MSKVPADIAATVFMPPMPKMCFYAVPSMEIIHGVPLAPETMLRHQRFDNMREIPFDEFVTCHPNLPRVDQLTNFFCERESFWRAGCRMGKHRRSVLNDAFTRTS